jgi:hypothetical protein
MRECEAFAPGYEKMSTLTPLVGNGLLQSLTISVLEYYD